MDPSQLSTVFLDQSKDLHWMVDLDLKLIYANKRYFDFMKEATAKGKKQNDSALVEEFGEEDMEQWKAYYQRAFLGERFEIEEHFFNEVSGEAEYSQIAFEPLIGDDNEIFAVACRSKDITRVVQKKTEAHQLIDASLDVFSTINEEGNFVFVSEAAKEHWGYSPEELIGKPFMDLVVEEDKAKTIEQNKSIQEGSPTRTFINRYKRKGGGIAYNAWSVRFDSKTKLNYCVTRDAKEIIEQEERIRQSEKRFKALVQEGEDLFAIIDLEGNYTYMSSSSTAVIGIPPEEFIGKNSFAYVHPDDHAQVLSSLEKVATTKKVVVEPYRAKNQNNEWRWVQTTLTNMLDRPEINGIVINSRDITEETEEKERLKLLESVVTNTNDAVLITEAEPLDKPGPRIIYVNEAFTKMTGYEASEVIGKTPRMLQGPKSSKTELAKLSRALRNYKPCEITTINYKKSGEEFWINFAVTPVRNEKGTCTHFIAIERDVTESKQAQEKLLNAKEIAEENEHKMKEAQKLAHLGSWYYDVVNKVSKWSEETYAIWGLDPEIDSIELMDHQKLIHPKDWERFNATIENATEKGIPYKMELEVLGPDGTNKTVNTIGAPIFDENKNLIAFKGTTQDITERVIIENELRRAKEKAERSEYAMNQASNLAKIGHWDYNFITGALSCSDYIYRLYGLKSGEGELSYEEAQSYFDKPSQEKISKATNELREKGTSYDLELRIINAENEEVFVRKVIQPVYNKENEIIGKRGVIQNITSEKYLQELNREVARMVKIGSWSVDLEEQKVFWSKEVHEIHETNSESYFPSLEDAINSYRADFREMVKSVLENAIATGEGWDFEAVIVTANKKELWTRSVGDAEFTNGKCVRLYGGFQDINKRKQSEIRLESFANNLPGVAYQYRIDPDGSDSLHYVSKGVKEIWGFTVEEVSSNIDLAWAQIRAGGEMDKVTASINQSIETKAKWTCSYKYVLPSGEVRTHLGYGIPSFMVDGTILFNSVVLDVTKEAKNEELLEQTTKIARIGSWEMNLLDENADHMYWSPMILEILELEDDYEQSVTKGIEFYVGESKHRIEKAMELLMEQESEFDEELLLRTSKGNERWVRAMGKSEYLDGKRTRIFGSFQDIHLKKLADLELEKSLQAVKDYQFALDQASILAFTDNEGIITSVNDNFCKISNYSRSEVIGKTHRLINSDYHDFEFFKDLWKTISSGKVWRGEIRNQAKGGKNYWVDTTIIPFLDKQNKPIQYLAIRFDITDKKIAEQEVNNFRTTLENSLNEIYVFDSETLLFTYVNKGSLLNLGYIESEIKNLSPVDIKPDYSKESFLKLLQPLVKREEEKIIFFTNHKRKDGSLYPVEVHLQVVNEGPHERFLAIVLDITERKKAEEEILQANERFKIVTEATEDAIWDWNIEENTLYRSKAIERFFGEGTNLALPESNFWTDRFHPEDVKRVRKSVEEAVSDSTCFRWESEYRLYDDQQQLIYVIDRGVIVRDNNGKALRMVGSMTNITELKKSEQKNKFKANLLRTIGQAVVATDLGGIVNYWNRAAEDIYGWEREEAIGKDVGILTPSDVNEKQVAEILGMLKRGKTWSGEFEVQKKGGVKFPVRVSNSPVFDEQGKMSGMIGISSDITDEVKNKELLKKYTKELERSNEELEQFAFIASHDLQEPLRMVTSFMDLLKRRYADELDEKAHEYIHFATDGAGRMKQIILDLLEYSRATRPDENKEEVDFNELVHDFQQSRRNLISEQEATIRSKNLPKLITYRAVVTQVVHCLLDNALKYSKKEEPVEVDVSAEENEEEWKVAVKDNGIGIDSQFYDKIFTIFQRLHNNDEYEGTGIGLAVAKRHVEFLGGKIWLKSDLGKGTVFYFTIPKVK